MSPMYVAGLGAVSPAGWGVPPFYKALKAGTPLPAQAMSGPPGAKPRLARTVASPLPRPAWLAHPRMRRTSPITHYAAVAAKEALEQTQSANEHPRVALILCLYCGCIQHSYRFYDEVLKDPGTASPIVFPETVFAAPASHLAAVFENAPVVTTLVGDPATFLQGVSLGADWLLEGLADISIIIGAEETNWLLADALSHFDRHAILSGGAGAIALSLNPKFSTGVELGVITGVQSYSGGTGRGLRVRKESAARAMRQELPRSPDQLLCDGLQGTFRSDLLESKTWSDWTGARLSPKKILGEGLMAATAWQCVAACASLAQDNCPAALVSLVGPNQQALGAQFRKS